MKVSKSQSTVGRWLDLEHWLNEFMDKIRWPAAIVLLLMALLTASDVIGRYILSKPILGNNDIQQLMMVVIIFLSMGYCTLKARHASADIVTSRLSRHTRAILGSITWFLSALIFVIISWQVTEWGWNEMFSPTRFTILLSIKEGPFILVAAFGCFSIFLGSLVNFIRALIQIRVSQERQ
ncbi:MAG: TRAP transporter small permease [Dehalococcoidales bacterium]|nr:TRAP transporter small permease [Dehalococcoidales bacterium]